MHVLRSASENPYQVKGQHVSCEVVSSLFPFIFIIYFSSAVNISTLLYHSMITVVMQCEVQQFTESVALHFMGPEGSLSFHLSIFFYGRFHFKFVTVAVRLSAYTVSTLAYFK